MGDQADFATKFHNLDGDLKGERTKNLFKLLKTTVFENEQQLDSALRSLKPKSYQENLFYIETLIYFKRSNELIEVLKGGNEVHISKILKQAWFFQNIFDNVEPEAFVTEFLPHVSYAVKKKFLNRILNHWTEKKIDSLFEALLKKYGLPLAVSVLHKCSPTKIQTAIVELDLQLNSNQVLNIYNKSEELFIFYVNLKQYYNDEKVLKNITIKNPELVLKLHREQKIRLYRVGRRTSKNILNMVNDDVLKDTEYYLKFLNNAVVVQKLGNNFDTLFKDLFPNQLNSVSTYCKSCQLIKYYPKKRRWNLLNQTFTEKFSGRELKDLLLNFNSMATLNPPKEIVELWAEVHYKEQQGNYNNFLKYYPPSKAIPAIKEKINVTSDLWERQSLVLLLIETCSKSKDLDSLVEVLKYICFRHRNEEPSFRTSVLSSLKNSFKLEDFNENHWKYIDEQFQILRIQKQFSLGSNGDFMEKHLEYLVKNGKDYKPLLIQYLKDMAIERHVRDFRNIDLSISKRLYTEMVEHIEEVINSVNNSYSMHFKHDFFLTILNFCQNNSEFCIKIADFPLFVQVIENNFSKDAKYNIHIIANVILYNVKFPQYAVKYNIDIFDILRHTIAENKYLGPLESVFTKIILTKDRDDFANKMLEFYFKELFERYTVSCIVCWFLKNEPKILSSYMTIVADKYATCLDDIKIYRLIKHYSHLGFDKILSDSLIAQLDKNDVDVPRRILIPICILLSTNDFITFVSERYLPKKDKLDLVDDEMREIYRVQCEVAKRLAHVDEPYKMLPTIMKFCRGDYLQSALPSLQKAFYRSPERLLYSYVEALSKQAVSARKHAIHLSCEVLDKPHTLHLLANTKETNISSLKYLFSATLKYFLKNPSEELLDKVIENMNSIDVNDKETLDSLKDVTIPVKYRAQYIEKCWKYFEGLKAKEVKITEYLNAFLNHMSADILLILTAPFISDIINRYFPVIEERLSSIDEFVIRVLQTRVAERNKNFQIVFDILSKLSDNMRISFFKSFINNNPDQQLLALFAENWYKNFTLIDSFDEHISLKLNSFRLENLSVDDLAKKTVNYLEQLMTEFGYHCFARFEEQFTNAFNNYDTVEEYTFYLAILKYKVTPTTCTLVLNNIIHMCDNENVNLKNTFNEIINIIKSVETPIVRINFKAFLLKH